MLCRTLEEKNKALEAPRPLRAFLRLATFSGCILGRTSSAADIFNAHFCRTHGYHPQHQAHKQSHPDIEPSDAPVELEAQIQSGMPSSILGGHASTLSATADPQTMTTAQVAPPRRSLREPPICPTDEEALVPKKGQKHQKVDKRSPEYIIKSGLAGGIAGCAVSTNPSNTTSDIADDGKIGKNICWTS